MLIGYWSLRFLLYRLAFDQRKRSTDGVVRSSSPNSERTVRNSSVWPPDSLLLHAHVGFILHVFSPFLLWAGSKVLHHVFIMRL